MMCLVLPQSASRLDNDTWSQQALRMQINKNPSTGRVPLGEADTNSAHCTLREGALAAAAVAQKTPRSVAKPPPIARSAAPPPAPPPMPAKGSLFAGRPSQLTPTWLHDIPGHGCPLPHAHPQGLQPRSSSAVTMGNGHSANQQDPNSLNPDACGGGGASVIGLATVLPDGVGRTQQCSGT